VPSAAWAAVTRHVPELVKERDVPLTEQPVAVPLVAENVIAPEPDPPVVVNVSGAL
jgi:hypothetical protein